MGPSPGAGSVQQTYTAPERPAPPAGARIGQSGTWVDRSASMVSASETSSPILAAHREGLARQRASGSADLSRHRIAPAPQTSFRRSALAARFHNEPYANLLLCILT